MESLLEVWRGAICLQKAGPLLERGEPLCYRGGSAHPLLPILQGDPVGPELCWFMGLRSWGQADICPPVFLVWFAASHLL